jgi:hypothetical protein
MIQTVLPFFGLVFWTSVAAAADFDEDDFVIEGEIQKPEVTVVISRQNLNNQFILELKESFLKKIVDSVEEEPF